MAGYSMAFRVDAVPTGEGNRPGVVPGRDYLTSYLRQKLTVITTMVVTLKMPVT